MADQTGQPTATAEESASRSLRPCNIIKKLMVGKQDGILDESERAIVQGFLANVRDDEVLAQHVRTCVEEMNDAELADWVRARISAVVNGRKAKSRSA